MSNKHVEKTFLYLLALSVFLHLIIFGLITKIPPPKNKISEPTIVDLTDLPALPKKTKIAKATERSPRNIRKTDSKGREDIDRAQQPAKAVQQSRAVSPSVLRALPARQEQPKRTPQVEPSSPRGDGLFKPKAEGPATLFPGARDMARIENTYREKYRSEAEDGETKFMDTDDIRFGSFLRHLETAVYGTWNYPLEARQRGISGVTPVKITFNKSGEIVQVKLLDSSGSSILDDEVLRTLKQLGAIGSFPKGYTKETFSLIAFFQYGMGRGMLR